MRFRVDVGTTASELAWTDVFGPARGVAYSLIAAGGGTELATQLHDHGWAGHRLRPFAGSPPRFVGPPRIHGKYTTSDNGSIWFGSPVPRIAGALLAGLAGRTSLKWGAIELTVRGVELEQTPIVDNGELRCSTATPVLVKYDNVFIPPDHPNFHATLAHNLRHKADLLALPSDVELEILDAGPMRRFEVCGAPRHGATLSVRLAADPRLLEALYAWSLGLGSTQGFGWIK